ISNPKSANYGKWLSSEEFRARFAPSAADVTAVRGWLTSQGFTVDKTIGGGTYLKASGTTAQVEKAFATTVRTFSYEGKTLHANTTALSFAGDTPAPGTKAVTGILGLDQGAQQHQPSTTLPGPPNGKRDSVEPCSKYVGQKLATDQPAAYGATQPYDTCAYTPQQLQSAYGVNQLHKRGKNGRGVTVAITGAYIPPTLVADARRYNE